MRPVLPFIVAILICSPCRAAERKTWTQIRYVGGTVPVKASRYDWNTTMSVTADTIVVEIAPATVFQSKKTVRIKISQVIGLCSNDAAWDRVAAVDGVQIPPKPPTLFGVLRDAIYFGLIYETDDGKRGAMLLESQSSSLIMRVLAKLTGKTIEDSP